MRHCWTCNTEHDPDTPCPDRWIAIEKVSSIRGALDLFEEVEDDFGPIFTATYHGDDSCCGEGIKPGEDIRSDGAGGWIHADTTCERLVRG